MTRGALSFINQSFLFSAFVRGVLVLQPHGVDGSEETRERGSEGNVSYLVGVQIEAL